MDDMTIFNPKSGKDRYRIGEDLQVEDLTKTVCDHVLDPCSCKCMRCGITKKEQLDA